MTANRLTRRGFTGAAAAAAGLMLAGRGTAQARLQIAAVNYPLAYFAERIAGDLAEVRFPVPPGTDPSFWRPSIAEIGAIQSADLILLNGAGFADWTARTSLSRSRTVRTSAAFEDAYIATRTVTHSHGEGGAHSHTGTASYTWLDFAQAQLQAEAIAAALLRRRPEAEARIRDNLANLATDLAALAAEATAIGTGAAGLPMIASHPRYQYLARAYGLSIDAVEWDARTPASDAQWRELETMIGDTGARVFIWEAAPTAAALDRMQALGLANAVFPPLANRPDQGDFLTQMQASLDALRGAIDTAADR